MLGTSVGERVSAWKRCDQQAHLYVYLTESKALTRSKEDIPLQDPDDETVMQPPSCISVFLS